MDHPVPAGAPRIILPQDDWTAAYARGWRDLCTQLTTVDPHQDLSSALWIAYCARYAWQRHTVGDLLDRCHAAVAQAPTPWAGLLALVEWSLFRLSGEKQRLRACFVSLSAAIEFARRHPQSERGRLLCKVGAESLDWMAQELDKPQPHIEPVPSQTPADEDSLWSRLLRLWTAECFPSVQRVVDLFLPGEASIEDARERLPLSLLLIVLCRQRQEAEIARAAAARALAQWASQPALATFAPPLLLDGLLGCEPDGAARHLSWWLYEPPPLGVTAYPLAGARVDLHAVQGRGRGTEVLVQCNIPFSLEILTPETLYLEQLTAGNHRLTLTVLDRTEVKRVDDSGMATK